MISQSTSSSPFLLTQKRQRTAPLLTSSCYGPQEFRAAHSLSELPGNSVSTLQKPVPDEGGKVSSGSAGGVSPGHPGSADNERPVVVLALLCPPSCHTAHLVRGGAPSPPPWPWPPDSCNGREGSPPSPCHADLGEIFRTISGINSDRCMQRDKL